MPTVSAADFDAILETKVTDTLPGFGAATKVLKSNYQELVSHGNLRSYSMMDTLHACPRKYQIKKLRAATGNDNRINSPTFAFGHAVGAGVAVYDETRNLRDALWAAFLAWDIDLMDEERKTPKSNGKSFWEACWALYAYEAFYHQDTGLADYDMVKIEGTICVDFEDGHYYVGHIDELLRNRVTGRLLVKENKTTGLVNVDPVQYQNSDQGLSYSIVVDMLGGTEYEVLYTVYSASSQSWMQFPFVKNSLQKAEWLQDQLLVSQQIDGYATINFFPKRGRSCFNYMRRCEEYETCGLNPDTVFQQQFADLPRIASRADIEQIEQIDFFTTLTEIVERQKGKLNDTSI